MRETAHRSPAIYELPLVVTAGGPEREQAFRAAGQRYVWIDSEAPAHLLDHPVTLVRREDAVAYCKWLSLVSGRTVRLPIGGRVGESRPRKPGGEALPLG